MTENDLKKTKNAIEAISEEILKKRELNKIIEPDFLKNIYESKVLNNLLPFSVINVKLKNIKEKYKKYEEKILNFFPFVRRDGAFALFSKSDDENCIYNIQFYEQVFLSFFDYTIVDGIKYYPGRFPASEYIKNMYDKKTEKRKSGENSRIEKLILNSSFGILATKNKRQRQITAEGEINNLIDIFDNVEYKSNKKINELTFEDDGEYKKIKRLRNKDSKCGYFFYELSTDDERKYGTNTIPVCSVCITSAARFKLYSYFLNVIFFGGKYNYDIYYCDTDSLFVNENYFNILRATGQISNDKLGLFKIENETNENGDIICYDKVVFLAPKSYIIYHKNKENEYILKGTGADFNKKIGIQQRGGKYFAYEKSAIIPEHLQKRKLINNIFVATSSPEPGTGELKKVYEKIKNEFYA